MKSIKWTSMFFTVIQSSINISFHYSYQFSFSVEGDDFEEAEEGDLDELDQPEVSLYYN